MSDDSTPTAVLVVTVSTFHRVLDPTDSQRCTDATVALKAGQSIEHGVSILSDGSIQVTKKVDLCFEMAADTTTGDTLYYPIGLAFRQSLGSDDPDGRTAFPHGEFASSGSGSKIVTTLTVRDEFDSSGVNYRFLIAIQRASDGAFGVIDPLIKNQSS